MSRHKTYNPTAHPPTNHPSGLVRGMLGPLWRPQSLDPCAVALAFLPAPARPQATQEEIDAVERAVFGVAYPGMLRLALDMAPAPMTNSLSITAGRQDNFNISVRSTVQAVTNAVQWARLTSHKPRTDMAWDELPVALQRRLLPQLVVAARIEKAYRRLFELFELADNQVPEAVAARWLYPGVTRDGVPVQAGSTELARKWADWFDRNVASLSELEPAFAMMRSVYAMKAVNYRQMRQLLEDLPVAITFVSGVVLQTVERLARDVGIMG